jgi:light-regulated signal transduction histidine kinase (bacteriophytochrome)
MTPATENDHDALQLALYSCENEPIHQISSIQSQGVMLVVAINNDYTLLQASNNIDLFFDLPLSKALGNPLLNLLGEKTLEAFAHTLPGLIDAPLVIGRFVVLKNENKLELNSRIHQSGQNYVIEITQNSGKVEHDWLVDSFLNVQRDLWGQQTVGDIYQYSKFVADMTRRLLGFGRVMVYRFDTNWEGEVIAESCVEGTDAYLGNRFPAGDIPPQARRLYTSNYVRMIADVEAQPAPLIPELNPLTQQPLDMSLSMLRSFSRVHVEYLRNMGVRASLSISLMQNGHLWGLIACHNSTPKLFSNDTQRLSELISTAVSVKLSLIEELQRHDYSRKVSMIVGDLLNEISSHSLERILGGLLPDLLNLCQSSGLLVIVEGKRFKLGDLPDDDLLNNMLLWLGKRPAADIYSTDHLSEHYPEAVSYVASVAGILATPITPDMHNCVIWFRKEKLSVVHWSGKPEKNVVIDPSGKLRISPRTSFATWTETWRGRCDTWLAVELESAIILSKAMTEALTQKNKLEIEIAGHSKAAANLRRSNADLQRFAEVTAHHFQESARRIANYAGQLGKQLGAQTERSDVSQSLDIINAQSRRLMGMLGDVERYLAADQPLGTVGKVNVKDRLSALLKNKESTLQAFRAEVTIGNLPNVLLDIPRLDDLFRLTINNALTYGQKTPLRISVNGEILGERVRYRISDNGVGIEEQYRERVFRVFERLQTGGDGSGIGLAIVRRIVENTGGMAWIEETPGGGCTVLFDLPSVENTGVQ